MQLIKISLAEQARNALLEAIVNGKLKGGERLTEEALCAEFAISRTPVRDALGKLESDGLIERLAHGGYQVKKLDYDAVDELLSCRISVEMQIFQENHHNIFQEGLRELYSELQQLDPAGEDPLSKARSIDDALHKIINDASANRYWREIHSRLLKQRLPYRDMRNNGGTDQLIKLKNERLQLLEAILSGDRQRGSEALLKHLENGKKDILSALKKNC